MQHRGFSQPAKHRIAKPSLSRRRLLQGLGGSSALLGLGGCDGGFSFGGGGSDLPPAGAIGQAALLAPLSGRRASIGQIMTATASLGGQPTNLGAEVAVVDAGEDAATAVTAATTAVASGAKMILGPLFSAQARAVADAVGRNIPVVSLSNDSEIAGGNLFVFGLTPQQSAKAVIGFAATRGNRNIAVVVPPGAFGALSASAAKSTARAFGVAMPEPLTLASADGLINRLKETNGGKLPDAVYLPVVGGPFEAQARALKAEGVQLLGSEQWGAIAPFRVPALIDGWFAAPDPVRFEAFANAFESQTDSEAGIVAGLTFDAVEMARILGRLDRQSRKGLLREAGFDGVLGPYRFTKDGQCERSLAVLSVVKGATTLIGASAA